ncbi:MAG TPA: NmrA family NAD(P)-binding protein [Turneriella sp.]|nr:NmrA family NAD(P)-binding protein [Turneriella sp.]
MKVFVTGASGNVGIAVIHALIHANVKCEISAGVRSKESPPLALSRPGITIVDFDFTNSSTFAEALRGVEILFLLRPPPISDAKGVFGPLIKAAQEKQVKHIIFLSVQGAENSRLIPHHKIEEMIRRSGIAYTFIRPAYFMQNFLTSLNADLKKDHLIYLPAGKAQFTLVDVRDIGAVVAQVIDAYKQYENRALELTSHDLLTFGEMAEQLSQGLGKTISFVSPSLFSFYRKKRAEGAPRMLILVMIFLHFLPRFSKIPRITDDVELVLKRKPISFAEFIHDYQDSLR